MADVNIRIYGGNVQIVPNAKTVTQHVYTSKGKTTVITKITK